MMKIGEPDIESPEKCRNYTVSVIECGRIGAIHACLFADAGFKVMGVHTDPHALELLRKGRISSMKGASTYRTLEKHVKEGSFSASSDVRKAASESNVIIITVQTLIDERKKPDYSLLEKACREIGMGLRQGTLIIFSSPTGPGTVESSMREVLEKTSGLKAGIDFGLAYSPLRVTRQENPAFRMVGAINQPSLRAASLVLRRIPNADVVEVSDIKTAEAVNLFQDVNYETLQALSNELASLCEMLKIDFLEVLKAASKSEVFRLPLPGMTNGSTRRDLYLLREEADNVNSSLRLTTLAERINDEVADNTLQLVKAALKACGKTVRRSKISVLGVSRSPDAKEPPGVLTKNTIALLKKKVRAVQVYDPYFSVKELRDLGFEAEKLSKVVEKTDCVVVLAGHSKFGKLNLKKVGFLAKKAPAIVDVSHVIDPSKAERYGFVYRGLGRGVWTK